MMTCWSSGIMMRMSGEWRSVREKVCCCSSFVCGIHWLRVVCLLSLQVQAARGAIGSSLRSCQVDVPDLMEVQDPRAGETSLAELTGIQFGILSNQDTVSASMLRESWFTYVALIFCCCCLHRCFGRSRYCRKFLSLRETRCARACARMSYF